MIDLTAELELALARLRPTATGVPAGSTLAGIGWATVELDRAERDFRTAWPGLEPPPPISAAPPSVSLGAATRVLPPPGPAWPPVVLLEPNREGRLAATLARHDEGWAVAWWDPGEGLPRTGLGVPHPGPLGTERLVLGGGWDGPHHLLRVAATIRS